MERPSAGLRAQQRVATRRRIAVASWRPSNDGRIYTRMAIDASALLAYVAQARERTGAHVTITHVVGVALARALVHVPEVQARVVFGRVKTFETCDISFAVDVLDGVDLGPVKVKSANEKTPVELARELGPGAAALRAGLDPAHRRSSAFARHLPWWSLRGVLNTASLLVGGLGVPAFGQPGFPMGTAFVSNVGTLGLDEAFLTPLPLARVPLYLAIGAVRDAPSVVDGQVVVRPQLVLVATGDHRLIDGAQAGRIATLLRAQLGNPEQLDERFPGEPEDLG
ncbi:MAG: 2-oxo acid dehydrogenase subunit E2 [Nocardioidaceae bacterium]